MAISGQAMLFPPSLTRVVVQKKDKAYDVIMAARGGRISKGEIKLIRRALGMRMEGLGVRVYASCELVGLWLYSCWTKTSGHKKKYNHLVLGIQS